MHTKIVHLNKVHEISERQNDKIVAILYSTSEHFSLIMSFINLLKSTGSVNENFSPAENQHTDTERMFQGYPQNPYLSQQSETNDNIYYPGYIHNNGYGLKFGSSGSSGYGNGYGQHHSSPHGVGYGEVHSYGADGHNHGYNQPRHKSKGNNSAMSALTLLAFLFFLNILQSCLKEHMMAMNPTVMIMTAGASRRVNQRTNDEDIEIKGSQSDYQIFSPGEDVEIEIEPGFIQPDDAYDKFFNQSEIKMQNANNYYRRKPHKT